MSTTSCAWLSLLCLLFCLYDVYSEELQFVKTPPTREVLPVGSNLTIDCTTNNDTARTAVYYRRSVKSIKWKRIETIPYIKVAQIGPVYTVKDLSKRNKGQYQCRASEGGTNSTETTWPANVGFVIIRGTLNKEIRKPDSKVVKSKKTKNKGTGNIKPGQKKTDKKRINRKRPSKRRPGSRKPGNKRPGNKRPKQKLGGGGKKPGKKDRGPKTLKPSLKASKNLVTVNESSTAVLKCTARVLGGNQAIMSWHRLGRMIGCSNKKDSQCSSASPGRYRFTYKAHSSKDGSKRKYTTYLRIPKTRSSRDQGNYVCMVRNKRGTTRQTIQLTIVPRRSS